MLNNTPSQTGAGLNLSLNQRQSKPGMLSYALNAVVESFDGGGISYQDEMGNSFVVSFPEGYKENGKKAILEKNIIVFWLVNPSTGDSEIGKVEQGVYTTLINSSCIGLDINYPIHKVFYRIVDCGTEVYWTNGKGPRMYINLDNLPFRKIPNPGGCGLVTTQEVDCNKLLVQPNFSIPFIETQAVTAEGELTAGTYQYALQYSNAKGEGYTSYHSITNPLPIQDPQKITLEFNYTVNRAIVLSIKGIDTTGLYDYINLAVIKTVNNISSFELVGTYLIDGAEKQVVYTGQKIANLTEGDIFEKFPVYTKADDIYAVQGVLGWAGMTTQERVSFQKIANQIKLQWQSWQLRAGAYSNPLHAEKHKGYMGDEVIPFSLVPLFKNGFQGDHFPIPGRAILASDKEIISNSDVIEEGSICNEGEKGGKPRWKVYNTATVNGFDPAYEKDNDCYEGPCQWGELAYWESTDTYPCDQERWGELAGTPIRIPKMPDRSTIPHYSDGGRFIYPLGIRLDVQQVIELIRNSDLSQEVKENIQGFKIVRGNRAAHKSIKAKGLITNVLKYSTQDNFIDPESISGSSAPTETLVQRLISSAISLCNKARAESGFPVSVVDSRLSSAITELQAAYNLTPGTPEFNTQVDAAAADLAASMNLLNAVFADNTNASATISYTEAAQQLVQSIKDSADAFVSIGSTQTIVPDTTYLFPNYLFNDVTGTDFFLDNTKIDETAKKRLCLHSPDTSFNQPTLGNTLKVEGIMHGLASSHMVEVREHSRYQFINSLAYITSLAVGVGVGFASGQYGLSTKPFDGTAAFTAYQTLLDIIRKVTPYKNPCYQVNAVGDYSSYTPLTTEGQKQRRIDLSYYLTSGMQHVGDTYPINNHQRESSVYLRTTEELLFTHEHTGVPTDTSKVTLENELLTLPISAYYASIKEDIPNQWGSVFSYEMVDTGFQWLGDINQNLIEHTATVFGGDTFIGRHAYKSKMPFFLDNRVGKQDEADIFYNELANVGKPRYWFSTDANSGHGAFGAIFGIRPTKFFNPKVKAFYTEGKIFLFAYGIPYFFCESEVNLDLRQAFNSKEGDFYPHTGTGIPDNWLQEINTTILQDNTYHYNKTYSKQNKENFFSYIPQDYDSSCDTYNPFLTIYSDSNRWLTYRPVSQFEFPQNGGALTSLDAIENKAIVARFENKTLLYNTFLTINTSNPQAAYLGNDTLFTSAPPVELSETDSGYIGSQHKLFIKTPYGDVFTDSKRGCVFLLQGNQPRNIATPEVEAFLRNHLPLTGDNHFNGKGITGVYDPQNKRILLTKIDGVNSFTLSYNFLIQAWVSLHSYIPNYYVEHATTFYAGMQDKGIWIHGTDPTNYHRFFGQAYDYVIEYPINYQFQDEILGSVKDYSQVLKYNTDGSFVYTDDWFTSAILSNDQQCSGVLNLFPRPRTSMKERMSYPKYNADSKDIIYTKSNSQYNFNTFWNTLTPGQPIWKPSQTNLSIYKDLNQGAMKYSKQSHNKAPLMAKNLKIRLINSQTDKRIISNFLTSESQPSYK